MKNNYYFKFKSCLSLFLFLVGFSSFGQVVTVFNDDFSVSQGSTYTAANGNIGSSLIWEMSRSGQDFGARINGGRLEFTGRATGAAYKVGWVFGNVNSTAYTAPYTSTLKNNPGTVTWTFNMRQSRNNPNSINSLGFGIAYVLAGENGSTLQSGTGYAITLGNGTDIDPVRLVKYTQGLKSTTSILASNTANLSDFGNAYLSIKVTYTPSTGSWQLFVRNDGTTAFADPATGTLTSQGTVVDDTYTTTELSLMGGFMYSGKAKAYTAYFDNAKVTVAVPVLSTISPTSAFAGALGFTLTANGQNFTPTSKIRWNGSDRVTTYVSATKITAVITSSDIAAVGTASVTVANGSASSNAKTFIINSAGTPTLTVTPEFLNLTTTVSGSAMTASQYSISGANLVTADPVATAPTNFEISLDNTTFSSTLNIPRTGNVLTGQPRTIYVRKILNAPASIYDAVVTHTASGTSNVEELQINATVLATQPTNLSTDLNITNVTSTGFKVNWTSGDGAKRLVLIKKASAVNASPSDGETYTANAVFGYGSEIGTGNYVVYSGTGNSATVTGLSAATAYYVSVVEYNGTSGIENYTTSGLVGNKTTLNAPVGWQIYTTNTANTIDFDTTVDGVNTDAFQGYGFSPDGDSGQLNSKAWAVTGFSDGTINFGDTSAEDKDFDSGTSIGGESEGGVYAFETSPDNFSFGVQSTNADFSPGTITLKIQNQTGIPITSLNLGYKVFIYNDQNASTSFNFSHSLDNSTYNSITAINVISPTTADVIPEWKGYYRSTTITGLNILNNAYYYIRWTGGDSGNVAYDEFALDDISLVANPTSNFVPFNNTAESFVLNGNANLSGDLEVVSNVTFNGGKLSIGNNTLSIRGGVTNSTASGIKGGTTSNLIINGISNNPLSFDSTTLGTTNLLNNFTIATTAANTTTLANAVVVNGALTIDANQTLDLGTIPLTGNLTSAVVNGTLATKNTSALPIPSGKIWSGTGTVNYNSVTTAQTVVAGTYNSLTVTPTLGAVAGGNLTVNGILNLPTKNPTDFVGSLSVVLPNTLTMDGTATNAGIGDVTGDILRTTISANVLYTFGHKNTSIIFPPIGTLPTSMGLRVKIGNAPSWKPTGVKRIYDFKQTAGTGTKAVIRGHYLETELNSNNKLRLVDYVNRTVAPQIGTFEQGRSNFSITENWIELTNANVAAAFFPDFDIVTLGFAETAIAFSTWTGATSDSWNTGTNWFPVGIPGQLTAVVIPDALNTDNDPIFASGFEVKSINIESGGLLTADTDAVFNIFGGDGAWINYGVFDPGTGTSTVVFKNVDATIAGETTFNNLTIESGGGLRPLTGSTMHIRGTFTKTGTFSAGAFPNTVDFRGTNQSIPLSAGAYQSLTISGTGAIFPTSLDVRGNLKISNTVDFTGKTIAMTGVVGQTISGASATFNNLIINNTSGNVSLSNNASVTGTLTLTSGQLILNNNNLTLGANAVAGTFDSSKMIVTGGSGELRRTFTALGSYTFPIGENTSPAYSPMTVNVTAGSGFTSAYVGVSVKDGIHPNNYSAQNNLSRYWNVNQSGITGAVASISATYLPEDLTGAESSIAAAQLKGGFNQSSNPWIKFVTLASNTLSITGASLPSGMTSAFTGIKGETFTTVITGYGEFCQNDAITLTAETTGGDGPYTYIWSDGLGSASTYTPPSTAFGTINYTLIVRDANGKVALDNADVTILTASVGGTLNNMSQTICKGTKPSPIVLTGETGDILYWQRSADPTFATGTVNIGNVTETLTSNQAGIVNETTYFRAVVSNGTCGEVYSSSATIIINSTTWNGSVWLNGDPTTTSSVVINGDYTATDNLEFCNVTVLSGNVLIPSGKTLSIQGALTITSGTLTIEDGASFVQKDDFAINQGTNFTIKRNTQPMYRYDYTYWSSPVIGQTLFDLSPATLGDKFFGWNPDPAGWIPYYGGNHTMVPGIGYIVRAPQTYSVDPLVTTTFGGIYSGKPNNGVIEVPVFADGKYNLLGNPYPSALSADKFLDINSSILDATLYLWTHKSSVSSSNYSYNVADYATYNLLGGVGTGTAATTDPGNKPLGFIASGQAFFIAGRGTQNGTATFNNSMRVAGSNSQFFKTAAPTAIEKHRIWLNISNTVGDFRQMLLGYTTNATNGYDSGWDGELFSNSGLTIYGFAGEKQLSIEALPLPFNSVEAVPLGISTTFSGSHRITLDQFDGLFETQDVFLYDKLLQIVHNIKLAPYDFVTGTGTFDSRFEVVYYNVLGDQDFTYENNLYIYKEKETIVVKSPSIEMKSIRIIDLQGRVIETLSDINDFQAVLNLKTATQVLMVSITTKDNQIFTRKLLY